MRADKGTRRQLDGIKNEILDGARKAEKKAMEDASKSMEAGKDDEVAVKRAQVSRLKRAVRSFSEAEKRYLSEIEKVKNLISTMSAE